MNHSHLFARILLVFALLLVNAVVIFAEDPPGSSEMPGSILVFPFLTNNWDTRITFANTDFYRRDGVAGPALTMLYVHVFIIDGQTCSQADQYVCLTPSATISILASEFDPEVTGYMIVVAVDGATGNPTNQDSLIGDAFVLQGDYIGNYGAESFRAHGDPGINQDDVLHFGNLTNGYDYVATRFAFSIQSPVDAPGQRIVTVSLSGDLNTSQFATPDSPLSVMFTTATKNLLAVSLVFIKVVVRPAVSSASMCHVCRPRWRRSFRQVKSER